MLKRINKKPLVSLREEGSARVGVLRLREKQISVTVFSLAEVASSSKKMMTKSGFIFAL